MEPARKINPGITALIVIVLVGIAATAVIAIHSNSENMSSPLTSTTPVSHPTAADVAPSAG